MNTPKVKFVFAPHASLFYTLGFLNKHPGFGLRSERVLRRLKTNFPSAIKEQQKFLEITDSYRLFAQVKSAILRQSISSVSPTSFRLHPWQTYLRLYNRFLQRGLPKTTQEKGLVFVKKLNQQWNLYHHTILRVAKKLRLQLPTSIQCFVIPDIGEYGEGFNGIVVLGLDFSDPTIAFAVFLEEFVHLSLTPRLLKIVDKVLKKTPSPLREEALVGYLVDRFLRELQYDDFIRMSIVYGWKRGQRSKLIQILDKYFARK
jgi:hypothetical protein